MAIRIAPVKQPQKLTGGSKAPAASKVAAESKIARSERPTPSGRVYKLTDEKRKAMREYMRDYRKGVRRRAPSIVSAKPGAVKA